MKQLQEIKIMNETMIKYFNKIGMDARRNEVIKQILKDDACFFKIDKSDALSILHDVGIDKEKIELIYKELTSRESYYDLQMRGKISDDDKEIKIKYEKYDSRKIFENKYKK